MRRVKKTAACLLSLLALILLTAGSACAAALPAQDGELPRDWYGWWKMDRCSGDWSKMYGYFWDCCAEIDRDGEGGLRLILWDEDLPKETRLAEAVLAEDEGELRCLSGSFLDRELAKSDWTLMESGDECGTLVSIEGQYKAVGKGGFHYVIYLRPWGDRWPGGEDERPWYYESWYLPLLDAGQPMPAEIGKTEEPHE